MNTLTPQGEVKRGIQATLYESPGIWKSPCPHQFALDTVDEFLRTHAITWDERVAIGRFYGEDKRRWAIRHLRLSEASRRIAATIGQPTRRLSADVAASTLSAASCAVKEEEEDRR